MSINYHVNSSLSISSLASSLASFGVPMLVAQHGVTANRQDGPYSSLADVAAAGFTLAATPEIYGWATRVFSQRPRASQVLIGRRATAENLAVGLDAIEAVDAGSWYATNILPRSTSELMAMATWHESRNKIAVGQFSSAAALAGTASTAQGTTFTFGGTPTDGVYSIQVINTWTGASLGTASVTRATTPAANTDLAVAMRAAWDAVPALAAISAAAGGAGAVVDIDFDGLGNLYDFVVVAPAPGTLTEADTPGIQNPTELLNAAAFNNSALIYHDDDTEYLDAAWMARCLGFSLDAPAGAGSWAYQRVSGVTATRLTSAQKSALLDDKANYYSPVRYTSGVEEAGFTFNGTMASGRFIDLTTTIHLTQARLEEGLLGVFLAAAASSRPKIPYTATGLGRLQAACLGVLQKLVRGGHYAAQAVSPVTGRITPWVDITPVEDAGSNKGNRIATMQAEVVTAGAIHSIGNASTVGLTVDITE